MGVGTTDLRAGRRADALLAHPDVRRLLPSSRFLGRLHAATVDTLLEAATLRRADAGQLIQPENVGLDRLLVMVSGVAKVHCGLRSGQCLLVRLVGAGDTINASAVTAGFTRGPAVTALTDSTLIAIPAEVIRRNLETRADLGSALASELAALLHDQAQDGLVMADLDTTGRVAYRLGQLARRWSSQVHGALAVEVPLAQEELASWSFVSRESVAKALHRLRTDDVVSTGRRFLMVHDVDALDRLAGVETIDLTVLEESA